MATTVVVLAIIFVAALAHRQFMQEQRRQSCYARMLVVQQRQPFADELFWKQMGRCATGYYST
jgi:hypothetical protein